MADLTQIIEKTKELGQLLQDSDVVKNLAKARADYEQSKEIQDLMGEFNLHKMTIAAIGKQENPDEERLARHEEKLSEVYNKIMENELMTNYQQKSQAVETLMAQINNIISFYITGEEPTSCTGSCATCGGCSGK